MLAKHDSPFVLLILAVVLTAGSGCNQGPQSKDKAFLEGISSVDLVGRSKSITPDGQNDGLISLRIDSGGTITAMEVHNVNGQFSLWSTMSGSGGWALGVADKENPQALLNRSDGSVEIKVDKPREFLLYVADNGAVSDGKTGFAVIVTYADGTTKKIAVERTDKQKTRAGLGTSSQRLWSGLLVVTHLIA